MAAVWGSTSHLHIRKHGWHASIWPALRFRRSIGCWLKEEDKTHTYTGCLVLAFRQSWRPRHHHSCGRHLMTVRALMVLQQRPQLPERDSEAIDGCPCMSVQTLWRLVDQNDGWVPAIWSVRCNSGGGCHGWLDLSITIPKVFSLVT